MILLKTKITELQKELKLTISEDIVGLDSFEALQLEVKSLMFSIPNSPKLIKIAVTVISGVALLISLFLMNLSSIQSSTFYFSEESSASSPVDITSAKFLVKENVDPMITISINIVRLGMKLIAHTRLIHRKLLRCLLQYYVTVYNRRNSNYPPLSAIKISIWVYLIPESLH